MTSTPAEAPQLRDLALLRRARDRIDREYAQPLDVEACPRSARVGRALSRHVYGDTFGFEVCNDVDYSGTHWITVGPPTSLARPSCCSRRRQPLVSPRTSAAPSPR